MKIILYSFLLLTVLQSCVKDANVKIPPVEKKLVISSFISPQNKSTEVIVSYSQPIYNNPNNATYDFVTNATVVISSGVDSWTLPYDAIKSRYILDSSLIQIKAGFQYNLSVSTPNGKFAQAFTTVPFPNHTLTFTTSPNPSAVNSYIIHASWNDPVNSSDLYQLLLSRSGTVGLIKDEENPGGLLKRNWEFVHNPNGNDTTSISLSTISSEFYKYYDRLKNGSLNNGPFSEPYPMYTNVEGGLGIFAGFNKYKLNVFP